MINARKTNYKKKKRGLDTACVGTKNPKANNNNMLASVCLRRRCLYDTKTAAVYTSAGSQIAEESRDACKLLSCVPCSPCFKKLKLIKIKLLLSAPFM